MDLKKIGLPLRYTLSQSLRVSQFLSQVIVSGLSFGRRPPEKIRKELPPLSNVLGDIKDLFERDLKNIQAGIYKEPEEFGAGSLIDFAVKSTKTWIDLFRVERRRTLKDVQKFSKNIPMQEYPKYFAQTFHFQTDGYLSDSSANLYDHQVELVFAGSAQAMRRQALVPIYHYLQNFRPAKENAGENDFVHLIDIACGTGLFLKLIKENYPQVRSTGLDLSPWYLKKARQNLQNFEHIDFIEANAEQVPFKDEQFQIVTSIFMFHELPRRVRKKVIQEMVRILAPNGLIIIEDSVQRDDKPGMNASLENFPHMYHEPYYLDYIEQDFKTLFKECGLEIVSTDLVFFSKLWVLKKL